MTCRRREYFRTCRLPPEEMDRGANGAVASAVALPPSHTAKCIARRTGPYLITGNVSGMRRASELRSELLIRGLTQALIVIDKATIKVCEFLEAGFSESFSAASDPARQCVLDYFSPSARYRVVVARR
jgi:hypothetical protein